MASALNNIGLIHSNLKNYELALQHHQLSLELREETEDKRGIAASLNNIGTVHQALKQYSEAMKCYEQSLAIKRAIGDERNLSATIDNLGELHILLGDPEAAIRYCKEGLALAERLEVLTHQRSNCKCLCNAYKDLGKSGLALKYLERAQILGDSLHSEETSRKLQQLEFKLEEIEQKKLTEEQERLLKAETARRNSMQYSGILIAIIAFFGLLLMSGKLKLPRKVVEAGIFFTLLIVFEFLLVLTDPSVAAFAQGQPAYHLLINAALALLILPLHALFARLLRKRLRRQDVSS
jgi:tetratricopeptide (TPR) repeat protein